VPQVIFSFGYPNKLFAIHLVQGIRHVLWHLIACLYGILLLCLLYWHQSLHTLPAPSCCLA